MNPELPPNGTATLDVWKAYIRLQQRLKTIALDQYQTIPNALKTLTSEEIKMLDIPTVQAMQSIGALPPSDDLTITFQHVKAVRAYLHLIQKQSGNIPPILQSFSEDEIRNLGKSEVQALRYMNILPETLLPPPPSQAANPPQAQSQQSTEATMTTEPIPDYYWPHMRQPDPLLALERIGELYNEAARNTTRSIEKQCDAMGRAFRKAGG